MMKLDDKCQVILAAHKSDPLSSSFAASAATLWWKLLSDGLTNAIRDGSGASAFLSENRDITDAGLVDESESGFTHTAIFGGEAPFGLKLLSFSDWIEATVSRITSSDHRSVLEAELEGLRAKLRVCEKVLNEGRTERFDVICRIISEQIADSMVTVFDMADELFRRNHVDKKKMSRGAIVTADERRDLAAREMRLAKYQQKIDSLVALVKKQEDRKPITDVTAHVNELLGDVIEAETAISAKELEIAKLTEKQEQISPAEVAATLSRELDHMRELAMLASKRVHSAVSPFLLADAKPFTTKILSDCFNRVTEFDPSIFRTDRAMNLGKPSILLLPGSGRGIYDWKNNLFMIPLVPQAAAFMISVAGACIEYRLDCDDIRRLAEGFAALPEQKGIRSQITLRENLIRDYSRWMTSEYDGFRVLSKEARAFFEHEIGPKRGEPVFAGLRQPFEMLPEEYKERCHEVDAVVGENGLGGTDADIFEGAMINWNRGQFLQAYEAYSELARRKAPMHFLLYNLGIAAIKTGHKQDAVDAFNAFALANPQGYWAGTARDMVRRLQST